MAYIKKISIILLIMVLVACTINPSISNAAVKLNKTKATMYVGDTLKLKVSGSNKKVSWSTSKKTVATISNGVITAKKAGTAKIMAKIGSKKYTCSITVKNYTAKTIVNEFKRKSLPIGTVIVYNSKTDVNNLLGRPHQYTSKVNFSDKRVEQWNEKEDPIGGTIEVFKNSKDAKARYKYIDNIQTTYPFLRQYLYLRKNVLFRLDYDLTPKQAKKYYNAYIKIVN